jgi:hypothetical protein
VHPHDEEDHQAVAASMKMFGKMTRKEEDWFPVSLLCKRFNLRQPHPDRKHAVQGTSSSSTSSSSSSHPLPFHRPPFLTDARAGNSRWVVDDDG